MSNPAMFVNNSCLSTSYMKQSRMKCSVVSKGSKQMQLGVLDNLIEKRWSLSWDLPTLSWVWIELPNLLPMLYSLIFGGLSNQTSSILKSTMSLFLRSKGRSFQRLLIFGKKELQKAAVFRLYVL